VAPSQSSVLESVKVTVYALCYCTPFGATRQLTDYPLRVQITPVTLVRNLGVVMDLSLSFLSHVNHVIISSFYQLRRIKCSIKALPFDTAKSLVNSFVISRIYTVTAFSLDYYALDRLQRVMNAAARMLCGAGKYSHARHRLDS